MNNESRRLEDLLNRARKAPPLLSKERTESLLDYVDSHRAAGLLFLLLHNTTGLATAVVGLTVGVASLVMYMNHSSSTSPTAQPTAITAPVAASAPVATVESAPVSAPTSVSPIVQHSATVAHETYGSHKTHESHSLITSTATVEHSQPPTLSGSPESTTAISKTSAQGVVASGIPYIPQRTVGSTIIASLFDAAQFSGSNTEEGMTIFVEGGSLYSTLRGGFKNTSNAADVGTPPQNFGAATGGWGYHAALGIVLPVNSWIHASGSLHLVQFASTYTSPDFIFVQSTIDPSKNLSVQLQHSAALSIGEIAFEPAVRLEPFTFPVFLDAGLTAGFIYHQAATYSTSVVNAPNGSAGNMPAMPTPSQQLNFGQARTQFDVRLGLGTEVPLSSSLRLNAELRAQYGLVPLFADNYPSMFLITPVIGLRYMMP